MAVDALEKEFLVDRTTLTKMQSEHLDSLLTKVRYNNGALTRVHLRLWTVGMLSLIHI